MPGKLIRSRAGRRGSVLALDNRDRSPSFNVMRSVLRCEMELEALVRRVRGEFLEMPGLSLTFAQAVRLWGLERDMCERIVSTLVHAAFLRQTSTGVITRADA